MGKSGGGEWSGERIATSLRSSQCQKSEGCRFDTKPIYCHCEEVRRTDAAIRPPQLIPPNSYFLTYFLGTSTWVPPM